MNPIPLINLDHHRSRARIRDLGEVFTPEKYVRQMLDLFDPSVWKQENVVFFEPSAGNGNIVLPILERRLTTLEKKYRQDKKRSPALRALAVSLNTLWAIDICSNNVNSLRDRVFSFAIRYLIDRKVSFRSANRQTYLAHVLCTLIWQIQENEALSALCDGEKAVTRAHFTKTGQKWFGKNCHRPLDFKNDWCTHFKSESRSKEAERLFELALEVVARVHARDLSNLPLEFKFALNSLGLIVSNRDLRISGVA